MRAKRLIVVGSILLVINALAYVGHGFAQRDMIESGRAAVQAAASGRALTDEEEQARIAYQQWQRFFQPSPERLATDAEEWRGNPLSVIKARAGVVSFFHGFPYYHPFFWDIWCMMLIDMGLMKLGVLGAAGSRALYLRFAIVGYAIGIPVNTYTAWLMIARNFAPA